MAYGAKIAILFLALLTGFLLLFGVDQAVAHARHDHAPHAAARADFEIGRYAPAERKFEALQEEAADTPNAPMQPVHDGNCCCGSLACHAGVTVRAMNVFNLRQLGERLGLPVVMTLAITLSGGIERPPRERGSL